MKIGKIDIYIDKLTLYSEWEVHYFGICSILYVTVDGATLRIGCGGTLKLMCWRRESILPQFKSQKNTWILSHKQDGDRPEIGHSNLEVLDVYRS